MTYNVTKETMCELVRRRGQHLGRDELINFDSICSDGFFTWSLGAGAAWTLLACFGYFVLIADYEPGVRSVHLLDDSELMELGILVAD